MITVAIIGAGIGQKHLEAYAQLPEIFEVLWVIDTDRQRLEQIQKGSRFRVGHDALAAFDDPAVQLVDICLPPHLHVPYTMEALSAGKHVVCEKPLATSLADVERVRAAAESAGKQVFPVFQYRWGPSLAKLRHLVAVGIAGRPIAASLETHWSRDASYYAVPWRGTWAGEQGGAILGHAIHNHDLLTHVMGPVAAVSGFVATRVNEIETEDCAALTFELANGALATSSVTLGAAGDETRLRFVFEHLTATSGTAPYAPGSDPWTFRARNSADQPRIDSALSALPGEPSEFVGFFREIGRNLNGLENSAVSFEEGAASIELVTAIYHAARSGERVTLPLSPDSLLFEGWAP